MGEHNEGDEKKKKKQSEAGKENDNGGSAATTVVLKLDLHCEGCAKKLRHLIIKKFDGLESVKTDCDSSKLTVVGNVDPNEVKEVVENKIKRKVEFVSPQPNITPKEPNGADKKPDVNKPHKKPDDKKPKQKNDSKPEQVPVSSVLLKTRVHCEGCANKIKKIVGKSQGVEDVNVDLQKDTITIKGTMDMKELLPYLNVKLKRTVELAPGQKKDEGTNVKSKQKDGGPSEKPKGGPSEKPNDGKSEKVKEGGGRNEGKVGGGGGGEKKDITKASAASVVEASQESTTRIDVSRMEYGGYPYGSGYGYSQAYAYDPRQLTDGYGHQVVEYWHAPEYLQPPQMFSDENPNACSLM